MLLCNINIHLGDIIFIACYICIMMQRGPAMDGMMNCCHQPDGAFHRQHHFDERPVKSRSKIHRAPNGLYKISLREQGKPSPAATLRRESSFIKVPGINANNSTQKSIPKQKNLTCLQNNKSSKKMSLKTQASPERQLISSTRLRTPQSSSQTFKSAKLFKKKDSLEPTGLNRKKGGEKIMQPERKKLEPSLKSTGISPAKNFPKPKRTMEEIRIRAGVKKLFELSSQRLITEDR